MESGIYQIYNPINNKRYIGSSINIQRRLKEHKRNLRGGYHHNQHLQNAWNKYKDVLIFEHLEYCEPEYLLDLEQQYIDYYNSADRRFGYNIDECADHAGHHLSEETKRKIGNANRGKKRSPEVIEKCRQSQIGLKKPKQSETMKLKFANGEITFPRYTEVSKEKQKLWSQHISESGKKRYKDYANRTVGYFLKVEFENETLYFPSLREAARNLNVDKGGIIYAIKRNDGVLKKLQCKFSYITEEEFIKTEFYETHYNIQEKHSRNKTSGEK